MAPLLHRAAIRKKKKERNYRMKIYMVSLLDRATINKFDKTQLSLMDSRDSLRHVNGVVHKGGRSV